MRTRKSWREKMHTPGLPKVVPVRAGTFGRREAGTMLVPSPSEIDAFIRTVKVGSVVTIGQLRRQFAQKYLADTTCPLTTGIFVHIAAEVAEEDASEGKQDITPYWRVVKDDGSLNPKLPGGVERQAEKLRAEGRRILPAAGKSAPRVVLDAAD